MLKEEKSGSISFLYFLRCWRFFPIVKYPGWQTVALNDTETEVISQFVNANFVNSQRLRSK
ncbi:hypothetical protein SAMN00777080_3123 [Aquiflexum balticum DSM 16537]|uniref:Uncharacterized protein n=1 Tax=Aquiflexum balticum DSM 16537 TaxID=758820 RepID=A0A1W2H6I5_9BACT|nr:hypothetical protein SAMN00777080_3123 [Aquiflexum balticum DSM 16537]